jgi:hypothetical protein
VSLESLAAKASRDPSYLGHAIAAHQRKHGLTDELLAVELGVPVETLANLRLCGRLRVEDPATFAADVKVVADRFGCDAKVVARIGLG